MNSSTLKKILIEYQQKKLNAEKEAEIKKEQLYSSEPELQEIENKLTSLAISTTKLLIQNNDSTLLEDLKNQVEILKNKKIDILNKLNLSPEDLLPKYECPICKDTGYILNNDYTSSMCSCLKQKIFDEEYNKSNISNLKTQNFDNFSDIYYSSEINEEKYHAKMSPKDNILKIKDICYKFIENFDDSNEKNLLFTGNTGLGKTFLSSCIANELLKQRKNVLYQTAPVMLDTIIDYRFGKSNVDKSMYDNLLSVDLLIIDDLGTECMNQMKFSELFNIINTRLLNQNHTTKTIISTNLSLKNLYNNYDERIVSRIVGNYNICYFFGDDIRFKKR